MLLNGYQIFVRTTSLEAVRLAIAAYVDNHRCEAYLDINSDRPSRMMEKRARRTFILSEPSNGFVVVWEDGSWADKKLAQHLSLALATDAIWLMLSDSTDSWGFIQYARGEQIKREVRTVPGILKEARRFAAELNLPIAYLYFEDPNLQKEVVEFTVAYGYDR